MDTFGTMIYLIIAIGIIVFGAIMYEAYVQQNSALMTAIAAVLIVMFILWITVSKSGVIPKDPKGGNRLIEAMKGQNLGPLTGGKKLFGGRR